MVIAMIDSFPDAMLSFFKEEPILRCPYCKNRPKVVYEHLDTVKVYLVCHGVNHVIRSLKFDTRPEAIRDWNENVKKEEKEP